MKFIRKIFSSRNNILLAINAVACVIGGQFYVSYIFKDLETKKNHFVQIKIDQDTIADTYQTRYTPGSGYYTEIKTESESELPILLEDDSNSQNISTTAIIRKEKDSSTFKIINGNREYSFRLRSLTNEKTRLRLWILICTTAVAFGFLRRIYKTV